MNRTWPLIVPVPVFDSSTFREGVDSIDYVAAPIRKPAVRDWREIDYLLTGTARQRAAHRELRALDLMSLLSEFDPALVSTVCIGLDTADSDLDVICELTDGELMTKRLAENSGNRSLVVRNAAGPDALATVATFDGDAFAIEVYAEPLPVERQRAYRHLAQSARVVDAGGESARAAIVALRESGLKTEPAVAAYLGLDGDPYLALLEVENWSDARLNAAL